ncbi:39S ribosomal protein L22, mitochondrial [Mycoemilia scoparia]|uniref:39S ribosomal protein L22, mitochondrial n=1 Tax=Mycoemilia scoparia TaxID=417184 RepID=A0A9W8DRP4_9FUNG|nr:39S ribosomal protein L22, mitochondrial [Mycoemilia scoparia]
MLRNLSTAFKSLSLGGRSNSNCVIRGAMAQSSSSITKSLIHTSTVINKKKEPEHRVIQPKTGASSLFEQVTMEVESKSDVESPKGAKTPSAPSSSSIFDIVTGKSTSKALPDTVKEFGFSTSNFSTSHKKLRFLAKQIAGLPINEAIEQMQHSPKKAAEKIKNTLAFARKNAIYQKQMHPDITYVSEAWVGKGRFTKRIDMKARGRFGVMHHPTAHMKFVLKTREPKKTMDELFVDGIRDKGMRRKVRGFGMTKNVWKPLQENRPIYNPIPYYNW